jgi:hypothetical protein
VWKVSNSPVAGFSIVWPAWIIGICPFSLTRLTG